MNIQCGEVEAQEIGGVNDGGQWVKSGAPAFGIGAVNNGGKRVKYGALEFGFGVVNDQGQQMQSGAHAFGIGVGNEEHMPALVQNQDFQLVHSMICQR
jgi:hypothetical protein